MRLGTEMPVALLYRHNMQTRKIYVGDHEIVEQTFEGEVTYHQKLQNSGWNVYANSYRDALLQHVCDLYCNDIHVSAYVRKMLTNEPFPKGEICKRP